MRRFGLRRAASAAALLLAACGGETNTTDLCGKVMTGTDDVCALADGGVDALKDVVLTDAVADSESACFGACNTSCGADTSCIINCQLGC